MDGYKDLSKKYLKSPQWLRDIKTKKRPFWKLYKPKDIATKIKAYSHQEFNKENFIDEQKIAERIGNEQDLFNRNIKYKKITIDESFPKYIFDNKTMFEEWII